MFSPALRNASVIFPIILCALFFAFSPACAAAAEAEGFRAEPFRLPSGRLIVAPHPDSVVVVSRVWMIMKGEPAELKVNGVTKKWNERFVGDVHATMLGLEIGMVNLEIGEEKCRLAFGQNEMDHVGPKDWKVNRMHNMKPGPNPCMECHECQREDKNVRVGELNPPDKACFHCHETDLITKQHANTQVEENWMQHCKDCHFIHMSPHKYLLRKPREEYLKPGAE